MAVGCGSGAPRDAADLGYAIGYQLGEDFGDGEPPLDVEGVLAGVRDALAGREPAVAGPEQQRQLRNLERMRRRRRTQ